MLHAYLTFSLVFSRPLCRAEQMSPKIILIIQPFFDSMTRYFNTHKNIVKTSIIAYTKFSPNFNVQLFCSTYDIPIWQY